MNEPDQPLPIVSWRAALALWTLAIWGSRLRNAVVDEELAGFDRISAVGIAAGFVILGAIVGFGVVRRQWHRGPLYVLVIAGILRWTLRGPVILLSDEWEVGFKVVHTVLWLVTVIFSLLAWREYHGGQVRPLKARQSSNVGYDSTHGSARLGN